MHMYQLPTWNIGWIADFSFSHNLVTPFMHSLGDYSPFQSVNYGSSHRKQVEFDVTDANYIIAGKTKYLTTYGKATLDINNTYVDSVIEIAVQESDVAKRDVMYKELQLIWYAEANTLMTYQSLLRHWERDWVQGWFYNKLGMGSLGNYYYYLWKGLDSNTDTDPTINVADSSTMSYDQHTAFDGPPGTGYYNTRSDVYPYSDSGAVIKPWGEYAGETNTNGDQLVNDYMILGADGYVDSDDVGILLGQWALNPNP